MFTGPVLAAAERESLAAWLEFHRATCCTSARASRPISLSCDPARLPALALGLVRHMTGVESWFHDFDDSPAGGVLDGANPRRAVR